MIATPRIQRNYDHRLQAIVKCAGSIGLAFEHGIPRSTALGFLKHHDSPSVVSTNVESTCRFNWLLELSGSREVDTVNGSKKILVDWMIDLPSPRSPFTKLLRLKSE